MAAGRRGSGRREVSDPPQHEDTADPGSSAQDRQLDELTAELRVIIPGVTVLFAFLLTVPFASGFPSLDGIQRAAYFTAFMSTAVALVFLLGEGAYHRIRGRPYDKARLLKTATRQMVTALTLLAVALAAVVFLVTEVIFGRGAAVALTSAVLMLVTVTWFALPVKRRMHGDP